MSEHTVEGMVRVSREVATNALKTVARSLVEPASREDQVQTIIELSHLVSVTRNDNYNDYYEDMQSWKQMALKNLIEGAGFRVENEKEFHRALDQMTVQIGKEAFGDERP